MIQDMKTSKSLSTAKQKTGTGWECGRKDLNMSNIEN